MKKQSSAAKFLAVLLAVILVCCIVQNVVLTDSKNVRIEDVSWVTDDGAYLAARIFIPNGVTADAPAPAVVACHGYNNTLEVQEVNCIELSRRGYVVIAPDAYGHGNSTAAIGQMTDDDLVDGAADGQIALDAEGDAAVQDGGVYSALQYLGTLPFVDPENIGLIGHSMGGYTIQMAANRALCKQQAGADVVVPKTVFIMCEGKDISFDDFSVNVATLTPEFDEFASGHWGITIPSEANTSAKLKSLFGLDEQAADITYNEFYTVGSEKTLTRAEAIDAGKAGTLRTAYFLKGRTHPGAHNSFAAEEYILDFMNVTLKAGQPEGIPASNQIWLIKNIAGLVCLICFFLLVIPVAELLLRLRFFATIVRKPYPGVSLQTGKCRYWILFVIGMLPAALSFFPAVGNPICVKFMKFNSAIPWQNTKAFPMPIVNGFALFNVICGAAALLLYVLFVRRPWKRTGDHTVAPVSGVSFADVMKSLLLAAATFFCVYMTLVLAAYFFKVDFRFFTLSIKTIDPLRLGMLLRYAPFFAVFYVINSLTLNASVAVSGKKEWVNTLLCALENVGGLLVIHIVDYAGMYTSGTKLLNGYSSMGGNSALAGILLWGLLLVLPLAAIIARRLYKKTGNFWLAGFINTFLVTLFAVSNTAISNAVF